MYEDVVIAAYLQNGGLAPYRATPKSAGLDLLAPHAVRVLANDRAFVDSGVFLKIPEGYYGRVAAKSGLSLIHGIEVSGGGIIDGGDVATIKMVLYNFSKKDYEFRRNDPLAQIVIEKYYIPRLLEMSGEDESTTDTLYYKKTSPLAFDLRRPDNHKRGIDLKTVENFWVVARERAMTDLHVRLRIPRGYYGRVVSTKTNSRRYGIEVGAGVIDEDYRGNVKILLYNHTNEDHRFNRGDVIARLLLQEITYPAVQPIAEIFPAETLRGDGGFGSTDKKMFTAKTGSSTDYDPVNQQSKP